MLIDPKITMKHLDNKLKKKNQRQKGILVLEGDVGQEQNSGKRGECWGRWKLI